LPSLAVHSLFMSAAYDNRFNDDYYCTVSDRRLEGSYEKIEFFGFLAYEKNRKTSNCSAIVLRTERERGWWTACDIARSAVWSAQKSRTLLINLLVYWTWAKMTNKATRILSRYSRFLPDACASPLGAICCAKRYRFSLKFREKFDMTLTPVENWECASMSIARARHEASTHIA
jgi:hypothetical protein